jgi:hypothetical protein
MSCCGQKRNALKQSRPTASIRPARGDASPDPASAPGRPTQPRPSPALLAYLARNGRRGRWHGSA